MLVKRQPVLIVAVAFVLLASTYSLVNPLFESPDELWHFQFITHLARGGGLPVQVSTPEANVAHQEGSQPPLYYLLGAAITVVSRAMLGIDETQPPFFLNPLTVGQADTEERAVVLHLPDEGPPYRDAVLLAHLLRLFSVALGLGTVLATYYVGIELLRRRDLAVLAAAFAASIPAFAFLSASINNDNLVTLVSSLALWQTLVVLRMGPSLRRTIGLGFLAGLGAISKVSGLALLPLSLMGLAIIAWRQRSLRLLIQHGAIIAGLTAAVSGWWYARNLALYGDILGLGMMLEVAGRRQTEAMLDANELRFVLSSFWGVFGWSNVPAAPWFYSIFDVLTVLALLGLAAYLTVALVRQHYYTLLVIGGWAVIFSLALFRWSLMASNAAQGRLLFPAISALAVLAVAGLSLLPSRIGRSLGGVVVVGMAAISLTSPFLFIQPAYKQQLQPVPVGELPPGAIRTDLTYGSELRLIGYELKPRKVWPGQQMQLNLYWQVQAPPQDYLRVHVYCHDRTGERAQFVGGGVYYPNRWTAGGLVKAEHSIMVPSGTEPLLLQMHLGLYDLATGDRLPVLDGQGKMLGGSALLGYARVMGKGPDSRIMPAAKTVKLGDKAVLANWELSWEEAKPGGTISGSLYWRALRHMDKDYTVFVQLVGAQGLLAQQDAQPQNGEYPTSFWDPDELVADPFVLRVPPETPAGQYRLIVGMYDLATMQRLPVGTSDHIVLTEVAIGAG